MGLARPDQAGSLGTKEEPSLLAAIPITSGASPMSGKKCGTRSAEGEGGDGKEDEA